MSMFKVFGVTTEVARKKAEKAWKDLPLKKRIEHTPESCEKWISDKADELYSKMKPVAIGKGLASPQFAEELIALCKKTTTCRAMHVRINVPKTDSKGGIMINKKTNKPSLSWEKYNPEKDYRATIKALNEIKEAAYFGEVA